MLLFSVVPYSIKTEAVTKSDAQPLLICKVHTVIYIYIYIFIYIYIKAAFKFDGLTGLTL